MWPQTLMRSLDYSSEVIRNDTLKSQRHSVSKECRQQIRAQLFQQRENIDFDPKLKNACRIEIKEICGDVPHGAGQVNFLLVSLYMSFENLHLINITYTTFDRCNLIYGQFIFRCMSSKLIVSQLVYSTFLEVLLVNHQMLSLMTDNESNFLKFCSISFSVLGFRMSADQFGKIGL